MIYIDTVESEGQGVYFDTHSVERCDNGVKICGMVGDGYYEGEVLIELGRDAEVTFVDQWLGNADEAASFLLRCGNDRIRAALVQAALQIPLVKEGRCGVSREPAPHVHLPLFAGTSRVEEENARWEAAF